MQASEKTLVFFSMICSKCKNEDEKIFKEKDSVEIFGLIETIQLLSKYG